jgi:hypothetical protein
MMGIGTIIIVSMALSPFIWLYLEIKKSKIQKK